MKTDNETVVFEEAEPITYGETIVLEPPPVRPEDEGRRRRRGPIEKLVTYGDAQTRQP